MSAAQQSLPIFLSLARSGEMQLAIEVLHSEEFFPSSYVDVASQSFLIWVRPAILVQQPAHLSLSLAARFCLCRECGTLFAGREFLPENLWVKQGMGATAGEE